MPDLMQMLFDHIIDHTHEIYCLQAKRAMYQSGYTEAEAGSAADKRAAGAVRGIQREYHPSRDRGAVRHVFSRIRPKRRPPPPSHILTRYPTSRAALRPATPPALRTPQEVESAKTILKQPLRPIHGSRFGSDRTDCSGSAKQNTPVINEGFLNRRFK